MKYYKTSKFTKAITSTGFVAMTSCALIAVGAITWFTLSKNKNVTDIPQNNNLPNSSYPQIDDSYNNYISKPEIQNPTEDVNQSESDVPYTQDNTSSTPSNNDTVDTPVKEEKPEFVLPVTGNISKGYSDTALQYSATYGDMRLHTGLDILCEKGTEIKSATNGTIKSIVDDAILGKVITIDHAYDFTVKYCGIDKVNVKEGDKVKAGDIIGTVGDIPSECADKPHIHFEVFVKGESISPLKALGLE